MKTKFAKLSSKFYACWKRFDRLNNFWLCLRNPVNSTISNPGNTQNWKGLHWHPVYLMVFNLHKWLRRKGLRLSRRISGETVWKTQILNASIRESGLECWPKISWSRSDDNCLSLASRGFNKKLASSSWKRHLVLDRFVEIDGITLEIGGKKFLRTDIPVWDVQSLGCLSSDLRECFAVLCRLKELKYLAVSLDANKKFLDVWLINWLFQAIVDLSQAIRCTSFFQLCSGILQCDHRFLVDCRVRRPSCSKVRKGYNELPEHRRGEKIWRFSLCPPGVARVLQPLRTHHEDWWVHSLAFRAPSVRPWQLKCNSVQSWLWELRFQVD